MWVSLAGLDPRFGGMRGRGIEAVFRGVFLFCFFWPPHAACRIRAQGLNPSPQQ